jgi:hypothetical protein
MNQTSPLRCFSLIAFVLLLAGAGCTRHENSAAAPPPPPTPTNQAAFEQPDFTAEEYIEGEATVVAINRPSRKVTLQNARGQVVTVKVPADVDLNRVRTGANVLIGVLETVSVKVMPPGSAALGNTLEVASTQPGQPQGRAWGQQLTIVAEVTAIDLASHTVTLRGAGGHSETITVRNPEVQQRMTTLQVGDLVELTYAEALATRLVPKS